MSEHPTPAPVRRGRTGAVWGNATEAFCIGQFRYVLGASALFASAQWMERTAVGWLVAGRDGLGISDGAGLGGALRAQHDHGTAGGSLTVLRSPGEADRQI